MKYKLNSKQLGLPALMVLTVALYLNFQQLISYYAPKDSIIFSAWIVIPIIFLLASIPRLFVRAKFNYIALITLYFFIVLLTHSLIMGRIYNFSSIVYAFFQYGLWIGVFIWLQDSNPSKTTKLVSVIFLSSALIHATITIFEHSSSLSERTAD